jgi:hypothetical protein
MSIFFVVVVVVDFIVNSVRKLLDISSYLQSDFVAHPTLHLIPIVGFFLRIKLMGA